MMRFGVVLRGQFEAGEDPETCLRDLYEQAKLAQSLGFESITKTSHYSTHPLQMLQQIPLLARLSDEFDLGDADPQALIARLEELVAAGLVERR